MNRKIAVAAIVGGLVQTASLLRGQGVQVPRAPNRPPGGAVPLRGENATLTPAVVEDLQRQVAELTRRVDILEKAQASSVGFTKVGDDFIFAPATGNVTIKAPTTVTIQGASIQLAGGAKIEQKAGVILLN